MGEDAVARFFEKLSKEAALREELKDSLQNAVISMAARHGCDFTADDLAQRLAGEMSQEDLDAVAGGWTGPVAASDLSSEMLLAGLTRGLSTPALASRRLVVKKG